MAPSIKGFMCHLDHNMASSQKVSASHPCQMLGFPHSPHCQLCLPSSIPSLAGQGSSLANLVYPVQQAYINRHIKEIYEIDMLDGHSKI